jgi:hypothetical protein
MWADFAHIILIALVVTALIIDVSVSFADRKYI